MPARQNLAACRLSPVAPHLGEPCVTAGMQLAVVAANLGHSDTRMVQQVDGHLSPGFVVEQIRKHAPPLRQERPNVRALS